MSLRASISPSPSISPNSVTLGLLLFPARPLIQRCGLFVQTENWYYFGSTGWWDNDFVWTDLYDKATGCGKPTEPAPAVGSGPVYSRSFEKCKVSLDCTNTTACKGDIKFGSQ